MDKIENVVITLSKLINADQSTIKELLDKYTTMSEIEIIKDLSMISYRLFSDNEELYNYALTLIRNINISLCPQVEEMKIKLDNMHNNVVEGNLSLEENHKLIYDNLYNITTLFNEAKIDYYIVGALPCFIRTGQPLFRYHDDIDIMINENDVEKARKLIELSGYEFKDDRFPSYERYYEMQQENPPHTVLAQNPNNEFHLGFFMFQREIDNSITMREYSHRLEDDKVIVDVLERRNTPEGTALRYDDKPVEFENMTFRTSTIESVYHLKSYTKRPKDISDNKKIEPYINKERLNSIQKNPQENVTSHNVEQTKISNKQL